MEVVAGAGVATGTTGPDRRLAGATEVPAEAGRDAGLADTSEGTTGAACGIELGEAE